MRRSVLSVLVALFAFSAFVLGSPRSGWTQDEAATPGAIDGVTTTLIGEVLDEDPDGEDLVVVDVSLDPGAELPIPPDVLKGVFQIISGTATVTVIAAEEGQAFIVRDGETIPLKTDDVVDLTEGDVLGSRGADLLMSNQQDEPVTFQASLIVSPAGGCWICPRPRP
jgi:hypothetical protein